jgi:hypothetical protein
MSEDMIDEEQDESGIVTMHVVSDVAGSEKQALR